MLTSSEEASILRVKEYVRRKSRGNVSSLTCYQKLYQKLWLWRYGCLNYQYESAYLVALSQNFGSVLRQIKLLPKGGYCLIILGY